MATASAATCKPLQKVVTTATASTIRKAGVPLYYNNNNNTYNAITSSATSSQTTVTTSLLSLSRPSSSQAVGVTQNQNQSPKKSGNTHQRRWYHHHHRHHRHYHPHETGMSYVNRGSTIQSSASASSSSLFTSFLSSSKHNSSVLRCFSSDAKRDFYDVLGVSKGADKGSIKKAYFKLAKQYHPDANQGDEKAADKFKSVTEAYEVLSDDKKKELYDTYGHAGVDPNFAGNAGQGNPFGGAAGGNPFGANFDGSSFHFSSSHGPGGGQMEIDPEELFDAFFGGGRRQRGPRRGADLQMHIRLSFQEAVKGIQKDLNLRYQIRDATTGRVDVKEREVMVDVPAGIDSGMNLRLTGQGAEGDPGAPRGNLLVTVLVEDDPEGYFVRDGVDVHVEVPISITQAILGGTVDVRTLTGIVEMKIPKGCQTDAKLLMRNKGIPHLNHSTLKGSQIVHLKVEIPKKITKRQEELLREFDDEAKCAGLGISGRIAHAAESAFGSLFGSSGGKKKPKSKKNKSEKKHSKNEEQKEETDAKIHMDKDDADIGQKKQTAFD